MPVSDYPEYTRSGGVIALILAVIGIVRSWLSRRRDKDDELASEIKETESALAVALENGMVDDAMRLRKRLEKLRSRLRSAAACLAVALLCQSCVSGGEPKTEYLVIGGRINIVEPGDTVVVPELIPPAKKWYMVDNVGLAGWLGIETGGAE